MNFSRRKLIIAFIVSSSAVALSGCSAPSAPTSPTCTTAQVKTFTYEKAAIVVKPIGKAQTFPLSKLRGMDGLHIVCEGLITEAWEGQKQFNVEAILLSDPIATTAGKVDTMLVKAGWKAGQESGQPNWGWKTDSGDQAVQAGPTRDGKASVVAVVEQTK